MPEKVELLASQAAKVTAPHYHYQAHLPYRDLLTQIPAWGVDFLVGSSFGGYLAYHLSEALRIPCLLFNPALRHPDLPKLTEIAGRPYPWKWIVCGGLDTTVPLKSTLNFLETLIPPEDQAPDSLPPYHTLLIRAQLAHRIDLRTWAEFVRQIPDWYTQSQADFPHRPTE
jgi:hypothetical protein